MFVSSSSSSSSSSRRAFTLIELSIVLVIIGLIIGGVLTGRQIIQNARITSAVNAIQAYQAQVQTYNQNFGALPGDDAAAASRFSASDPVGSGNGNGALGGLYNSATATDESRLIWAHLRAAGLVKNQVAAGAANSSNTDIQPSNPFGGIFGFQNGAFASMATTVLCLDKVPSDAAQIVDSRLDDGTTNTGAIQASSGAIDAAIPAPDAGSSGYAPDQTYTLCVRL